MKHQQNSGPWWPLLAAACLLLASSWAQAALFERVVTDLAAENRAARAEGKQLVIALTLPDCPGCREMERRVFADPATIKAIERRYRTVSLDLSQTVTIIDPAGRQTTLADFAQRLHAVATPSFAFFDGQGAILYRYTGVLESAGFRQLADFVRLGGYEQRPFSAKAGAAKRPVEPVALKADLPTPTLPRHPEFNLAATDGRLHRPADFPGQVLALAVGYTQCPDVCPTTLAELKAAVESLPIKLQPKVQVLFVTLDPERDSLSLLGEYAAAFAPRGSGPVLGLRGDGAATAAFIRELQLVAERQPSASMGYTLDHTAGVFLIDGEGRLRGLSPYGQPVADLAADLATLAREALPARRHP